MGNLWATQVVVESSRELSRSSPEPWFCRLLHDSRQLSTTDHFSLVMKGSGVRVPASALVNFLYMARF